MLRLPPEAAKAYTSGRALSDYCPMGPWPGTAGPGRQPLAGYPDGPDLGSPSSGAKPVLEGAWVSCVARVLIVGGTVYGIVALVAVIVGRNKF